MSGTACRVVAKSGDFGTVIPWTTATERGLARSCRASGKRRTARVYGRRFYGGNIVNPLITFRESRGASRALLARQLGVSYSSLAAVENGLTCNVPTRILAGIRKLGGDPQEIQRAYVAWRREPVAA